MNQRPVATLILLLAFGALSSSCSNSGPTAASMSPVGKLSVGMTVSDAGQDPRGAWQYNAIFSLRETGGVRVTVTNIQVEVFSGFKVLATAGSAPMLPVLANSSGDTTLAFTSDSHLQVAAMSANVSVGFFDANGNTGSATNFFSCFGCSYDP
jgi:hypothetical protein